MGVSEPNNLGNKQSGAPEGRGCIRRHLIREAGPADRAVSGQEQNAELPAVMDLPGSFSKL